MEVIDGFEPTNDGFVEHPLDHSGIRTNGAPSRIRVKVDRQDIEVNFDDSFLAYWLFGSKEEIAPRDVAEILCIAKDVIRNSEPLLCS